VVIETRQFARPRVVVSRCLGFEACRYNGDILGNRLLAALAPHAELVTVCPEVAIGLGTPRDPIRIVRGDDGDRLVQPKSGRDVTRPMEEFSAEFLSGLSTVEGFVLKSRSPSCAISDAKIHSAKPDAPPKGKGPGLFGREVLRRFPDAAVEDEGRLTNYLIREHFLTRIFAFAAFRVLARRPTMGALVKFQAEHKLLFMALNQTRMRSLGRIVANHAGLPVKEVVEAYRQELILVFARQARQVAHINVLMHAFGYFSRELTAREKAHFLDLLERFRNGKVPLSAAIAVVRALIIRFEEDYLASQVYFQPFPEDLVEISDSGIAKRTK
jgi:uncharacterized protein YbgA (DUF1722 family)/uncharacterized protein YbbK (DUF523 family)